MGQPQQATEGGRGCGRSLSARPSGRAARGRRVSVPPIARGPPQRPFAMGNNPPRASLCELRTAMSQKTEREEREREPQNPKETQRKKTQTLERAPSCSNCGNRGRRKGPARRGAEEATGSRTQKKKALSLGPTAASGFEWRSYHRMRETRAGAPLPFDHRERERTLGNKGTALYIYFDSKPFSERKRVLTKEDACARCSKPGAKENPFMDHRATGTPSLPPRPPIFGGLPGEGGRQPAARAGRAREGEGNEGGAPPSFPHRSPPRAVPSPGGPPKAGRSDEREGGGGGDGGVPLPSSPPSPSSRRPRNA